MMRCEAHIDKVSLGWDEIKIQGWAIGTCSENIRFRIMTGVMENTVKVQRLVRMDVIQAKNLTDKNYFCGFEVTGYIGNSETCCLLISDENNECSFALDIQRLRIENKRKIKDYILKNLNNRIVLRDIWRLYKADKKKLYTCILNAEEVHDVKYQQLRMKWNKVKKYRNIEEDILVSIVVPLYNTPSHYLKEMVDSILVQTYKNWELCLADSSDTEETYKVLKRYFSDKRIRYKKLENNKGIAGNTNEAIKMSNGELIMFVDHDDWLEMDALYYCVKAYYEGAEVIYSDSDKVTEYFGECYSPFLKPDFNLDYLRSVNYICHLFTVSKKIVKKVGLLNSEYEGAQDYDYILRCCESTSKIIHIPYVLYHWRVHENSVSENEMSKRYAYDAGRKAIEASLKRAGEPGSVLHGSNLGLYEVRYEYQDEPLVTIVTESDKNDEVLKKTLQKAGYSNYEILFEGEWKKELKVNGDFILHLEKRTLVETENWLKILVGCCQRKNVAAVGTKVYNNKDCLIGGMLVCNGKGNVLLAFEGYHKDLISENGRSTVLQDCSAVTTECIIINRKLLEKQGVAVLDKLLYIDGFSDLCFEATEFGMRVIWNPNVKVRCTEIMLYEGIGDRFLKKWEKRLQKVDQYYHPEYNSKIADYSLI